MSTMLFAAMLALLFLLAVKSRCTRCLRVLMCAVSFVLAILPIKALAQNGGGLTQEWQFFRINAQYRGAVKKSFRNVGCAAAKFVELPGAKTRVILYLCAVSPDKKHQKYCAAINFVYRHDSGAIKLETDEFSRFDNQSSGYKKDIESLIALWAYIQRAKSTALIKTELNANETWLSLSPKKAGRAHEITCSLKENRGFSAKFFCSNSKNSPISISKVRFRHKSVVVSVIKDSRENIVHSFAGKEPYKTEVFAALPN